MTSSPVLSGRLGKDGSSTVTNWEKAGALYFNKQICCGLGG